MYIFNYTLQVNFKMKNLLRHWVHLLEKMCETCMHFRWNVYNLGGIESHPLKCVIYTLDPTR